MSKRKAINPKQGILVILLFCIIFGAYFYLRGNNNQSQETEKLLSLDLQANYPETPRSVVKMLSRISKCLYNERNENEDVNKLVGMMRILYSEELLEMNPEEEYLKNYKSDIAAYQKERIKIMTYQIESSDQMKTWTEEGVEYSSLIVAYALSGKGTSKSYERFVLKKDENNKWKVIGWKVVPETDLGE